MPIPPSELKDVIRLARAGHGAAQARLYQNYAQAIYRYIAYRVPDEDAEDLTAEVFVSMVRDLPGYTITDVPFEVWLYRIAAARIADYYRRRKNWQQTELSDQLAQTGPLPEEKLERHQEQQVLRDALQQLSAEQQTVLLLRFVEEKTHEEVADVIGKSVSAVKSIQHRALYRLASLLGSESKVRHYLRGRHDET